MLEDLQLDKELGHGAFSTVRLGINRKNKDKFAVKVVHKSKLSKQDIDALHVEVGILSKLRHPHVVKYFDFTQDSSHYYIVLEVVAGGEVVRQDRAESILFRERGSGFGVGFARCPPPLTRQENRPPRFKTRKPTPQKYA